MILYANTCPLYSFHILHHVLRLRSLYLALVLGIWVSVKWSLFCKHIVDDCISHNLKLHEPSLDPIGQELSYFDLSDYRHHLIFFVHIHGVNCYNNRVIAWWVGQSRYCDNFHVGWSFRGFQSCQKICLWIIWWGNELDMYQLESLEQIFNDLRVDYRLIATDFIFPHTWHATSCESVYICNLLTPITIVISNPFIRASYSVSLLVAGNSNMIHVWKDRSYRLMSTMPTPSLVDVNDPSMKSFQGRLAMSSVRRER